jgi:uncharacterized membrane protein
MQGQKNRRAVGRSNRPLWLVVAILAVAVAVVMVVMFVHSESIIRSLSRP